MSYNEHFEWIKWRNDATADVEPVKHGHNDNRNYHCVDEFRCSRCGIHLEDWVMYEYDEDFEDEFCREYEFKFCPNCGAIMDGDPP